MQKSQEKCHLETIDKMFKTPSSTTLSTLLKVCDGLDLNLKCGISFHRNCKNIMQRMGSNVLSMKLTIPLTTVIQETTMCFICQHRLTQKTMLTQTLVHGVLKLGDFNSMHECSAILDIDSGDLTTEGSPFSKHYEGTLIYSSNSQMFCRLVCSKYGDMWFMVFNHGNLNNKELACVVGCAATASSGRYPPSSYPSLLFM